MSRLVIVGAGGFGREVLSWVGSSPKWTREAGINEIVFVDDNDPQVDVDAPIVSTVRDYVPASGDLVICAVGSPEVREIIVVALRNRGARFATFVHDRAVLGSGIELGTGVVICPNTLLSSDIRVGEHVHINSANTIGHDVTIGDFATLSSACNLTGGVALGRGVFLGTASTIIPGKHIGDRAYVGAGSVVLKDVPSGVTVFGNPSKSIGTRAI